MLNYTSTSLNVIIWPIPVGVKAFCLAKAIINIFLRIRKKNIICPEGQIISEILGYFIMQRIDFRCLNIYSLFVQDVERGHVD